MNDYQIYKDDDIDIRLFEEAIKSFEIEAMNFATRFIQDAKVRSEYIFKSKALSDEYLVKIKSNQISPYQAAREVNLLRNEIMNIARLNSSDIGKAKASALKEAGLTLEVLCEKYAKKLFDKDFTKLTKFQQDEVFKEIIKAAGKTRPSVNLKLQRLSKLGKGLFVLSLGVAVYNVTTSENKVRTLANEGVIIGGGFAGGAGGGFVAGLACGPGAPVCVTVGVFVGGLMGGLGFDIAFDYFFKEK